MSKINQNLILPSEEKGQDLLKEDEAYTPWADKMYEQDLQELDSSLENESHTQEQEHEHI